MRPPEPASTAYAAAFVAGLLDPSRPPPAAVSGPGGRTAARRYNVYRNNVTVSLINTLGAIYPATRRLTGDDFFRAMARSHVRVNPPASPLLFEYGRAFPAFIADYEHARATPWLADVARLERAWLDAYHAADIAPLTAEAYAAIAAHDLAGLRLTPHPATRVVASPYPVVTLFAVNRGSGGEPALPTATGPEDALITRPGLEVTVRHLPPGGAAFVTELIGGATLAAAAMTAAAAAPDFDLAANLAGIISAGAFAALATGDGR